MASDSGSASTAAAAASMARLPDLSPRSNTSRAHHRHPDSMASAATPSPIPRRPRRRSPHRQPRDGDEPGAGPIPGGISASARTTSDATIVRMLWPSTSRRRFGGAELHPCGKSSAAPFWIVTVTALNTSGRRVPPRGSAPRRRSIGLDSHESREVANSRVHRIAVSTTVEPATSAATSAAPSIGYVRTVGVHQIRRRSIRRSAAD